MLNVISWEGLGGDESDLCFKKPMCVGEKCRAKAKKVSVSTSLSHAAGAWLSISIVS